MAAYAQGKYALAISDRSGQVFPYREMVREWNGAWVHTSEYEPKQPQLEPKPISADPQGLLRARPARVALPTPAVLNLNPILQLVDLLQLQLHKIDTKELQVILLDSMM